MQKAGGMSGRRGLFGGGVISAFQPVGAASGTGRGLIRAKTNACEEQEKARAKRKRFARALFSAFGCSAQSAGKLSLSCGQQRRCRRER